MLDNNHYVVWRHARRVWLALGLVYPDKISARQVGDVITLRYYKNDRQIGSTTVKESKIPDMGIPPLFQTPGEKYYRVSLWDGEKTYGDLVASSELPGLEEYLKDFGIVIRTKQEVNYLEFLEHYDNLIQKT